MKHKPQPGQKPDVITLADLAPRHRVTGGSERRVFGANAGTHAAEGNHMAGTKKTAKDLPGKTASVKGGAGSTGTGNGKLATNDNVTLVRG